ncbi:MAG TPA: ATP-binding protein [Tepidisphaeraceae bacterium]|nr:ATP-binding protein [Tepidisphaeraceae bacterium]
MNTAGGKRERAFELRISSDPANLAAARKAVESFALDCALGQRASHDLGLCLNEVLANIMRHAYGGRTDRPIVITAEPGERELTVRVRDWGNGIDPTTIRHEPYNPLTPGGVGLICLTELLDRIIYTPQPDGMLATMVKKRKG